MKHPETTTTDLLSLTSLITVTPQVWSPFVSDSEQVIKMRKLVLSLGARTCTLLPDELQKHPDSLLTKFASTLGDDISKSEALHITRLGSAVDIRNDSITIKLDKLPNAADGEAVDSWESFAFDILPSLYRYVGQCPLQQCC